MKDRAPDSVLLGWVGVGDGGGKRLRSAPVGRLVEGEAPRGIARATRQFALCPEPEGALDLVARRAFLAGDLGMRATARPREEVPPEAVGDPQTGAEARGAAR